MEQPFATASVRRRVLGCAVALAAFALLALALFLAPLGCSSGAECVPSRCPAGSACIEGAGASCHQVCTQQADCPFNWYCNDGHPKSWCVRSTIVLAERAGQWGESCVPVSNCDTAGGFACYGTSPADATAFCTIFDCRNDSDCKGGWWCATVDVAPNVTTPKRSFGPTRNVCLPRSYCATCQMDHDCPLAADQTQQHCAADSQGNGFCSPQCASNSNCPLDATCNPLPWAVCAQTSCKSDADCQGFAPAETCALGACRVGCHVDGDCPASNGARQHCAAGACIGQACATDDDCPPARGIFQHCNAGGCTPECAVDGDCNPAVGDQTCVPLSVCMPRAGVCVGDGTFCAPCGSDADCSTGYCLAAPYSMERFCSQVMHGATCSSSAPPAPGSCPTRPGGANYKGVACTTAADRTSDFAPADHCIGVVTFGSAMGVVQYAPGCWTANR